MDLFDLNKLIKNTVKELEEDRFLNLINLVMGIISTKKITQIEEIIFEAKLNGFKEEETYKAIDKLIKDKIVEEYKKGYLKRL